MWVVCYQEDYKYQESLPFKDYIEALGYLDDLAHNSHAEQFTIKKVEKKENKMSYPQKQYYARKSSYGAYQGQSQVAYGRGNGQMYNAQPPKKKSGCKLSKYIPKSGPNKGNEQFIVNGWKKPYRSSLVVYKCVLTSKSKLSDKGWYGSVACEVLAKDSGQKSFYWGTMEKSTGKVVIDALGIVLNPKGGRGGVVAYYGKKS